MRLRVADDQVQLLAGVLLPLGDGGGVGRGGVLAHVVDEELLRVAVLVVEQDRAPGLPPVTARAFTCDQVRWAVRTFPASVIRSYARRASAADLASARRCLHPLGRRNAKVTP